MKKYDVVVIGGGPAGSTLANSLAKNNLKVALIERKERPGFPVHCAEAVAREDLEKFYKVKHNWVAVNIDGAIVEDPEQRTFKVRYKKVGYVLERRLFDRDLFIQACNSGTVPYTGFEGIYDKENNSIKIRRGKLSEKIRADIIVGADGVESKIGEYAGIDTRLKLTEMYSCAQYTLTGIETKKNFPYFIINPDYAPFGYVWIFPKSENTANVGLGFLPSVTEKKPIELLNKFLKERFKHYKIVEQSGGIVPAKIMKLFVKDNVILIGDAARLTDPLSGAGIINGIFSGIIAAKHILNTLSRGSLKNLKSYEKELKKEIISDLKFKKRLLKVYTKLNQKDFDLLYRFGKEALEPQEFKKLDMKIVVSKFLKYAPSFARLLLKGYI